MNMEKLKFNKAEIAGEIIKDLEYSHTSEDEAFYQLTVRSRRLSENYDDIPVLISGKIIDTDQKYLGKYIHVTGQVRSFLKYNAKEDGKAKSYINVFAHDYELSDDDIFGKINEVHLEGHTCAQTHYKETPNGFEITDMYLSVSRTNSNKNDYVPCICWSRNARWADGFDPGTHVRVKGRIQGRFVKCISDTIYEVSVFNMNLVDDEKNDGRKCEDDETGTD